MMAVVLYLGLDIQKKTNAIAEVQGKISSHISQVSDINKLKSQEVEAQVDLLKLNNILPRRDSLFGVSKDLGAFAVTKNLAFGSKFGEEVSPKDGKPGFIKMEMNVEGSYDNIISFLKHIETSSYFINLFGLDLTRQKNGYVGAVNGEVFFSN